MNLDKEKLDIQPQTTDIQHNITFVEQNCLKNCCLSQGLPQKCLEKALETSYSMHHNTTHIVMSTVLGKDCHKYKSIMDDCTSECINMDSPQNNKEKQKQEPKSRSITGKIYFFLFFDFGPVIAATRWL